MVETEGWYVRRSMCGAGRWLVVLAVALTLLIEAGTAGLALAHSVLAGSDPADNAVLAEMPGAVRLRFSEPVDVNASIFKVYPLAAEGDLQTLRTAASELVNRVLRERGDEDRRADAGVAAERSVSQEVQILLKEDLPAGSYVVMWRVLSVDTHVVEGHFIFHVQPDGDGG